MSGTAIPTLVLDTNVVLDWLVFRDPSCDALGSAIERGRVRWLASAGLHAEWLDVAQRGIGASRSPDFVAIAAIWQRYAVMVDVAQATRTGQPRRCHCSDADDQQFIDLALQHGASWLLSRDRAVLRLAREARTHGLQIIPPSAWFDIERT